MRQIDSREQEKSETVDMIISRHSTARKMSRARASHIYEANLKEYQPTFLNSSVAATF